MAASLASTNFRVGFAATCQNDPAFQLYGRLGITCDGSHFMPVHYFGRQERCCGNLDPDEGYSYSIITYS